MTSSRRIQGRRWTKAALAAVAVLGLAASATACGGGDDASEESITIEATETGPSAAELVARASDTTSRVESGRMRFTYDYDFEIEGESASATMEATGAFSDFGRRTEVEADMTSYLQQLAESVGESAEPMPGSMRMRAIQDGSIVYMRVDSDPPEAGTGVWYMTDYAELGLPAEQLEQPAGFGGGISAYVESLKGAGQEVVEAGREEIDGVAVTRLEGEIDLQAALDQVDPAERDEMERMFEQSGLGREAMPFVAWVDDDGVLRRMSQVVTMDMGVFSMSMTVVMEIYDLGADVTITPPPADQVQPMTDELLGLGTA